MPQLAPDLVGTTEAAEILGWPVRKVKRHTLAGHIPYIRKLPGRTGAYLFDRAVIETIAANRARAEAVA